MLPSISWWPFTSAALTGLHLVPGSVIVAVGGNSPAPGRPQTPGGLTASVGGSSLAPVPPATNGAPVALCDERRPGPSCDERRPGYETNGASARPATNAAPGRTMTDADFDAIRAERIVTAVRTTGRVTLDGRLDEPAWRAAPPATDFLQSFPTTARRRPTERTEVRFVYDDDNLYVGVICFDSEPARMVIKDLREDFDFNGTDMVQILIDSLHDRRTGFTFVVNAAGARRDTQVSTATDTNQDWDGVWDAKVSHGDGAWFIEFVIPFKTLRFSKAAVAGMGRQHQPADPAPQRGRQLGAGADPVQRQRSADTGRHAQRASRTCARDAT